MRILYITSVLGDMGGSEIYCRDVINALLAQGHSVLVASTEPYPFNHSRAEFVRIPSFGHHALHKFTAPFFWGAIRERVRVFRPEIVQSHSNCFMGLLGDRVKQEFGIPHVLLIEMISEKNKNLHTQLIHASERFLLPRLSFDCIVVWTEHMKNKFLLPWGIAENRIAVIPAALSAARYALSETGESVRKKYGSHLIVSIKSLWQTNLAGVAIIVRSLKFVKAKHPEYRYLIAGPGDGSSLEKLAREEGVAEMVELLGPVDESFKRGLWAAAEIAPHAFVYEFSTSISLLEFLAVGKAMVVNDIGAVREYLRDSVLVVPSDDPQTFGEGINRLIEDPVLRRNLEEKSRKLFESEYSVDATAHKLLGIYQRLLH